MRVSVELTEVEFKMLTSGLVNYIDLNIDAVCNDADAKSWRADMDVAVSIRDKFVAAIVMPQA